MKVRNEIYKILAEWNVLDADNINKNTAELKGNWESDKIVDRVVEDLEHILPYHPSEEIENSNALYSPVFDSDKKYNEDCVAQSGYLKRRMKTIAKRSATMCDDIQYSDIRYRYKTIVEGTKKVNDLIQNIYSCFENADGAKDANLKELISMLCMKYEIADNIFPYLTNKKSEDYHIDRLQFWAELAEKMGASKNQSNITRFNFGNVSREIEELAKDKAGGTMGQMGE